MKRLSVTEKGELKRGIPVRNTRGFLLAETIVSFTLLGVIVVGLAVSTHGYGLFNRYQWARQRCLAAAQAQIDSLAARAVALDTETCRRLWPEVQIVVEKQPASGQWEGLECIQVTATAPAGRRQTAVKLVRYIQPNQGGQSL